MKYVEDMKAEHATLCNRLVEIGDTLLRMELLLEDIKKNTGRGQTVSIHTNERFVGADWLLNGGDKIIANAIAHTQAGATDKKNDR